MYRRYAPEPLDGEKIDHRRVAVLRQHIGRTVEYNQAGWLSKRRGVLQEAVGRNIRIDDNWEWAPSITLMHVLPEASP